VDQVLRDRRAAILLVGPALLVYSLVVLVPIGWSLVYATFEGNLIGGFRFVGLDNLPRLAADGLFWKATGFTLRYAVVVTAGQIVMGVLLALLYLFYLKRASGIVRTLVFFPVVLPTVAVAELFAKMVALAPQYGLVNAGLDAVGLDHLVRPWLGFGDSAFAVLVIMDIWRAMGFYAVILYAGLVDIPAEILDAARIDGATGRRLVTGVVLPLIRPILAVAIVFSINGTLKVFDSVMALTRGGPGQETMPLTVYMFRSAFEFLDYGYASAVATALGLICLLATLALFRFMRRDVA
jgi:raffinose/stachyose/melibiose transport system permease protein